MTQPASKLGPVTVGGSETFGNSSQGVFETLADIQSTAQGCAEWIDNLASGTGQRPEFAHDHRGGVWGRPLGVGHSMPMRIADDHGFFYQGVTFLNVPDVSSPNGDAYPSVETNGGYQYVDLYIYHNTAAGTKYITANVSVWRDGVWTTPNRTTLELTAPGGGASWTQTESLQLPAGLVRLELINQSVITDWEWSSFVIPQR